MLCVKGLDGHVGLYFLKKRGAHPWDQEYWFWYDSEDGAPDYIIKLAPNGPFGRKSSKRPSPSSSQQSLQDDLTLTLPLPTPDAGQLVTALVSSAMPITAASQQPTTIVTSATLPPSLPHVAAASTADRCGPPRQLCQEDDCPQMKNTRCPKHRCRTHCIDDGGCRVHRPQDAGQRQRLKARAIGLSMSAPVASIASAGTPSASTSVTPTPPSAAPASLEDDSWFADADLSWLDNIDPSLTPAPYSSSLPQTTPTLLASQPPLLVPSLQPSLPASQRPASFKNPHVVVAEASKLKKTVQLNDDWQDKFDNDAWLQVQQREVEKVLLERDESRDQVIEVNVWVKNGQDAVEVTLQGSSSGPNSNAAIPYWPSFDLAQSSMRIPNLPNITSDDVVEYYCPADNRWKGCSAHFAFTVRNGDIFLFRLFGTTDCPGFEERKNRIFAAATTVQTALSTERKKAREKLKSSKRARQLTPPLASSQFSTSSLSSCSLVDATPSTDPRRPSKRKKDTNTCSSMGAPSPAQRSHHPHSQNLSQPTPEPISEFPASCSMSPLAVDGGDKATTACTSLLANHIVGDEPAREYGFPMFPRASHVTSKKSWPSGWYTDDIRAGLDLFESKKLARVKQGERFQMIFGAGVRYVRETVRDQNARWNRLRERTDLYTKFVGHCLMSCLSARSACGRSDNDRVNTVDNRTEMTLLFLMLRTEVVARLEERDNASELLAGRVPNRQAVADNRLAFSYWKICQGNMPQ
ncbi:hypothetical protein CONPUDRAFT_157686 [Coniophora puteana RWD-64-598 SS2]|uniref:Uncharacterized protein n=1 Tax=Coniophora puteana (strain RWD-64-598) TaxID=741705 RepID=A0A5M3MFP3_CONPW|nr:uncharacterized protein CONPUDRAFT_157686 [Coniophora puteana RWD-64-598 SS2]EIW77435.1 hypothetical protein CONPUDRAFT_157686 [Coniophora puteana RWD-64-598 SS2]